MLMTLKDKLRIWEVFSSTLKKHIILKGKKYDWEGEILSHMSDSFCADSMWKYAKEIAYQVRHGQPPDSATLFSIAHYAQELWKRKETNAKETRK